MGVFNDLFRDIHQCPVCNRPLLKEGKKKTCPSGHIRFQLRLSTQRWYLSVEVPKSRIRIKETGELFDTIKAAAIHIGGTPSAVHECLNGKNGRKHHKGYTFEYADDEWQDQD